MHCPDCGAENPNEAMQCSACGSKLSRRPRRRTDPRDADNPSGLAVFADNPAALTAYRCSLWGLIPFVGLALGPAALGLGVVAWWRNRANPNPQQAGRARAAMILGTLTLLTNWGGLVLMWLGLTSGS